VFVCIEGIDGSGKGEISRRLAAQKPNSSLFSYPDYANSSWGKVIGEYLNGDYGGIFPLRVHAGIFALERLESKPKLQQAIASNDYVFVDRYVPSNMAYSAAAAHPDEVDDLLNFVVDLEYRQMDLPVPDFIFYLDMPLDLAIENIKKKKERIYTENSFDLLEAKRELLHNASSFYKVLPFWHPPTKFVTIDCRKEKKGSVLKDFAEIASEICSFIN
jgi:dTMP kinase